MSTMVRYGLVGVVISTAFVNFISCGSQMYQASLQDDHQQPQEGSANSSDPSSPEFGLHAPNGWTQIPIVYSVEPGFSDAQLKGLQAAMKTWETAVGKTLFTLKTSQNPAGSTFPDLFTSLRDGFDGHYVDTNWKKNNKSNLVLATTIWDNRDGDYRYISASDIHYNSEIYFIADALTMKPEDDREIVDMQSLALHELGHLLGLAHVDADIDSSSIMNPSLYIGVGLATRSLSVDDVKRIQKIYGCEGSACDADATAQQISLAASSGTAH